MATLEERLAFLEGRVAEHSRGIDGIRDALVHLEQRIDRRFQALEERIDRRFQAIDSRFQAIDARFESIERRLGGMDDKLSRYFVWMVGIQVTTLAAIVAALAAR